MQNKPNLLDTQMNVTSAHITSYQLPVTNYQYAKQTQTNPISIGFRYSDLCALHLLSLVPRLSSLVRPPSSVVSILPFFLWHTLKSLPSHVPFSIVWKTGRRTVWTAVPAGRHHRNRRQQTAISG